MDGSHRTTRTLTNSTSTLAVIVSTVFAYKGLESVVSPAIPIIKESLNASEAQIAWLLTAVLLTGAVSTPLIGRLADTRDKKRVLLWVLAIVGAGVIISATAVNVPMIILGQLLQGVGLGVVPLAFAIINETQNAKRAAAGNSAVIAFIYAGTAFAIIGSGALVSILPWRWLFCVPLILIAIIFTASIFFIPSCPPQRQGRVDWIGAGLLGASIASLLIGFTEAPNWGWLSLSFFICIGLSLLFAVFFVRVELKVAEPLINLRILTTGPIVVSCIVYVVCGFSVNMMFLAVPLLAEQDTSTGHGLGASAFTISLILLPIGLVGAIAAPLSTWLEKLLGRNGTLIAAIVANGASFAVLLGGQGNLVLVLIGSTLMGASGGIGLTEAMNLVTRSAPAEHIGAFSGLSFVLKAIGGTVGVQLAGSILATGASDGSAPWSSFVIVFSIGMALTAVTVIACLFLPRQKRSGSPNVESTVAKPEVGIAAPARDGR